MCVLLCLPIEGDKCQMPSTPGVPALLSQIKKKKSQTNIHLSNLFYGLFLLCKNYGGRLKLKCCETHRLHSFPKCTLKSVLRGTGVPWYITELDLISGASIEIRYFLWLQEPKCKRFFSPRESSLPFSLTVRSCLGLPYFSIKWPFVEFISC